MVVNRPDPEVGVEETLCGGRDCDSPLIVTFVGITPCSGFSFTGVNGSFTIPALGATFIGGVALCQWVSGFGEIGKLTDSDGLVFDAEVQLGCFGGEFLVSMLTNNTGVGSTYSLFSSGVTFGPSSGPNTLVCGADPSYACDGGTFTL